MAVADLGLLDTFVASPTFLKLQVAQAHTSQALQVLRLEAGFLRALIQKLAMREHQQRRANR